MTVLQPKPLTLFALLPVDVFAVADLVGVAVSASATERLYGICVCLPGTIGIAEGLWILRRGWAEGRFDWVRAVCEKGLVVCVGVVDHWRGVVWESLGWEVVAGGRAVMKVFGGTSVTGRGRLIGCSVDDAGRNS
jgi:hypothetical protein